MECKRNLQPDDAPCVSADDANAVSTNVLAAVPAFRQNPPTLFSSTIAQSDRDELLAKAIPALSPPIGATAIAEPVAFNYDMNES